MHVCGRCFLLLFVLACARKESSVASFRHAPLADTSKRRRADARKIVRETAPCFFWRGCAPVCACVCVCLCFKLRANFSSCWLLGLVCFGGLFAEHVTRWRTIWCPIRAAVEMNVSPSSFLQFRGLVSLSLSLYLFPFSISVALRGCPAEWDDHNP